MSTFMDDGNILVKCKNRFLVFSNNGFFLNEVQFEKTDLDLNALEIEKLVQYNIGKTFKEKNPFRNILAKVGSPG